MDVVLDFLLHIFFFLVKFINCERRINLNSLWFILLICKFLILALIYILIFLELFINRRSVFFLDYNDNFRILIDLNFASLATKWWYLLNQFIFLPTWNRFLLILSILEKSYLLRTWVSSWSLVNYVLVLILIWWKLLNEIHLSNWVSDFIFFLLETGGRTFIFLI